jgi:hypothetical protein
MYYPQHQIVTDLYTNGGELKYIRTPFEEYIGAYYKTADGSFYSGTNPNQKNSEPLEVIKPSESELSNPTVNPKNNKSSFKRVAHNEPRGVNMYIEDADYYASRKIKDRGDAPRPPIKSIPYPTEEDYNRGIFERYFIKKGNESQFIEVSLEEYRLFLDLDPSVDYNLYVPIKIGWNLKGSKEEVYNRNESIVALSEQKQKLYGFKLSFKGKFDKYWRG